MYPRKLYFLIVLLPIFTLPAKGMDYPPNDHTPNDHTPRKSYQQRCKDGDYQNMQQCSDRLKWCIQGGAAGHCGELDHDKYFLLGCERNPIGQRACQEHLDKTKNMAEACQKGIDVLKQNNLCTP